MAADATLSPRQARGPINISKIWFHNIAEIRYFQHKNTLKQSDIPSLAKYF